MTKFVESTVEEAAIEWLKDPGYSYALGPEIAFDSALRALASQYDVYMLLRTKTIFATLEAGAIQ